MVHRELWWVVLVVAILLGCSFLHDTAHAQVVHNEQIVLCDRNLIYNAADKVGETINPNSTLSEWYDTNGDGKADIETQSYLAGFDANGQMRHNPYPFIYIVDIDFDEEPDKMYVDIGGNGRCDEIRFYKDLRDAKAPWPDYDTGRSEGQL